MDPADTGSSPRWLSASLVAAGLSVLAGCASTFPRWRPDRCRRADPFRDTLNRDFLCRQKSP